MRLSFTNTSPIAEATLKACLNDLLFNLNNKDFYVKGILFLGVDSRLGFINTGKLYAVESINGKLAVSVPWTDNDTWRPIKIGDTLLGNEMLSLQPGNNVSLTKLEDVVKINILLGSGSGLNADTVDGKHASDFSTKHITSLTNFNNAVDSNIVTFDGNNITNKPSGSTWLNGFVSSHSNYLASYIVNEHRTNNWWLGYKDSNNSNTNVSWVNIIHSGNISNQSVASAGSATKLLNARAINGTNFDGTVNITTANWGTARNITIGDSTKSVNGSTNVSWSLSEIGIDSKFVAITDLPLYINNFTGAVNNGNTYGVELTNGKLTVTVPWTDNDTWRPIKVGDNTLTNDLLSIQPGDSITISLELVNNTNVVKFSTTSPIIKTNYVGNGKNYPVLMDSNKNGYVNVPWTDNDTWRPVKVGNLVLDNKLLSIQPGNNVTITSEDNNNDVVVKITANIPSSLPANGGTSDYSNNFVSHDTRNVNNTPLTFNKGGRFEFKGNSTDGLNDGGSYHGVLYFRPYGSGSDWSGGPAYELGFTLNGNLWMKSGSNDTWSSWKKFINSGELNTSNINSMYNWYSSITGTDTDKVINKWNEIISFLANIKDDTTLENILGGYLPRSGSVVNDKKTDATNKMTGSIWFDNVDGIKINSHDTDRKIWEIVGNSGSYVSTYGFHLLYKGTASGNNNTLELYSHNLAGNHVKVSTIYLDGTLTFHTLLTTSYGTTHTGIKVGSSYINSLSDQLLLLNTSTIRFGGDTWDWNVWAGLKYDHTNKVIYLGLADGTVFNANTALAGGIFKLPGINTIDLGKTTNIKNLPVNGGIYWNPYVESTTDGSDVASITLTKGYTGSIDGLKGSVLKITLNNDANDTILFVTNALSTLYHNENPIITSANYNNYTVTKTGTGASGTWEISISGTANTANTANALSRFTSGNKDNCEHDANNINSNGIWYYTANGPATSLGASTNDGALYSLAYNTSWVGLIAQDYRNGNLFVRGKNNGTWQSWKKIACTADIPSKLPANGGAADTLTTSRTIWGLPFDGSADITGLMTSNSIFVNTGDSTLKIYSGKITDAKSDGNICFQTSIDATDGQTHSHPTNYGSRCNIVLQPRGGLVYIGSNPDGGDDTCKLNVSGSMKTTRLLVSTVATGTAPLAVSSTTVVSNLNADLLDGTHKSGLFTSLTNDTTNNTLSLTIGGVTKSTTVNFASKSYELNLQWGGNTKTGSLSPLGTAMSNLHSVNRLAFSNVDGMTVEISHNYTNASPTWSTHSCTNDMKINVISGIQTGVDIKLTNSSNLQNPLNTSDALRITLAAKVMGIYIHAKKLLLNISSGCEFYVKIEKASSTSNEQALTGTSWETLGSHLITGWSGWNEISLNTSFGGYPGLIQTSFIRLTFYFTKLNPTSSSNAFRLINMCLFGDNYYLTPSSLAETGHIYKYDANQNAIFPNSIQAKTIVAKDYIQINDPSFLLFTHPNGIKSTVKLGSDGVLRFYTDATFKNICNIEANILRGYKVITDKESCFGYNGSYTDPAPGYEGSIKAAGPIYCGNLIQASAFYENSDIRLKKDVSHIILDNLNKAKNIEFKQFKFNNSEVLKYGVIAQEIENIGLDSLVKDEYTKSVDYISLLCLKIALLELEIKELKNDIVR